MTKTELLRALMAAAPDAEVVVVATASDVGVRITDVEIIPDGHRPWGGPARDMIALWPASVLRWDPADDISNDKPSPSESET